MIHLREHEARDAAELILQYQDALFIREETESEDEEKYDVDEDIRVVTVRSEEHLVAVPPNAQRLSELLDRLGVIYLAAQSRDVTANIFSS